MAHLGQIDRRNPGDVVFTRYVTNNSDWKDLNLRIENGQFAEMFEKVDTDVESLNITIHPRTAIKLLSNKFEEIGKSKYAHIEYQRKKGYILISKIRKPTDDKGTERPPKLEILADTFTRMGEVSKITVLTQKDVSVMSFDNFDQLKDSIIYGAEHRLKATNPFVVKKLKTYLKQSNLHEIDLNGIDDSHIDELGIYFGEVLPGLLAFKGQLSQVCIPSDMLGNQIKLFVIPTDQAFRLVDSALIYSDATISLSSKYGAGAAASFMTNVLPYGIKDHNGYKNCFFKRMCKTAKSMGYTFEQVGGKTFTKSKNIMMEVGVRNVLKVKGVPNANHSVYNTIRKIATGKDITEKENIEIDAVTNAIEDYFVKGNSFGGGSLVKQTIRDNYPYTIPSFFNYTIANALETDLISKTYIENIIGGKNFYQANLDKSAWKKGKILIKMLYPKKAKLKILGSMSSALDYTTKHGMVNYELK